MRAVRQVGSQEELARAIGKRRRLVTGINHIESRACTPTSLQPLPWGLSPGRARAGAGEISRTLQRRTGLGPALTPGLAAVGAIDPHSSSS